MKKLLMLAVLALGVSFAHPFVDNLFAETNTYLIECPPGLEETVHAELPGVEVQCGMYSWGQKLYMMDYSNLGVNETPFTYDSDTLQPNFQKWLELDDGTRIYISYFTKSGMVVTVTP